MQGLAVVPLFAGYDQHRELGRVFSYDVTGGTLRGADYQGQGSGSIHARNWIKASWSEGMSLDDTVDLSIRALFAAADEDVATGGPDLVRGIFPLVAAIDAGGFRRSTKPMSSSAAAHSSTAANGEVRLMNMPFYVSPEQVMKDRADYARKGIARAAAWSRSSARRASSSSPTTARGRSRRSARSTTALVRRGGEVQRVPDAARRGRAPCRPQGLLVFTRRRFGARSWPTCTCRHSARCSPTR